MGIVKYTGPMASFHCPTNAEIRSLKVHFSPKQLGEGTPSPENVREIEGWDGVSIEYTKNNITQFEPYGTGGVNLKWSVPKSILDTDSLIRYSIYIDNSNGDSEACIRAAFFDINGSRLQSRTRSSGVPVGQSKRDYFTIHPFPSGTDYVVFGIKGNNFSIKEPMIDIFQSNAFKETPYEPYRGSTTNYTFGVLGKNKFNPQFNWTVGDTYRYIYLPELEHECIISFTRKDSSIDVSDISVGFSYLEPSKVAEINKGYRWCLSGGIIKSYIKTNTVFEPQNSEYLNQLCRYLVIYPKTQDVYDRLTSAFDIQIEFGSTATEYEPYNPKNIIYGGWVDLITGEVCEEYKYEHIDENTSGFASLERVQTTGGIYFYRSNLNDICKLSAGQIGIAMTQELYSHGIINNPYTDKRLCMWVYTPDYIWNTVRFSFPDEMNVNTLQDFNTWLESVGGVDICYPLQTPITYQLAPTQLQTFLGQNNVWSNADYVEVEYDLHETQSILARKQYIMANQPHIVKPAAAPLQNFVTDLAAPLKECKVHFEPVQEGSGDPSPNNVRVINGWTGMKAWRASKNLIDESYLANADNYPNAGNYGYYYTNDIQLVPNTRYRFVWYNYDNTALSELETNIYLYVSGASEYIVNNADYKQYSSGFITPATGIIRLGIYHPSVLQRQDILDAIFNNGKLLLQVGTDDIAYEPYSGTTTTLDWTTEAGTVYGGYVDLVTGEVVAEWKYVTIDEKYYTYISGDQYRGTNCTNVWFDMGSNKWDYNVSYVTSNINGDVTKCESFKLISMPIWNNPDLYPWHYVLNNINQVHCVFDNTTVGITSEDTNAEAITKIKAWVHDHPIKIAYRLAKAKQVSYPLTPAQIKTLRGTNNIWSNTNGNIELKYWSH